MAEENGTEKEEWEHNFAFVKAVISKSHGESIQQEDVREEILDTVAKDMLVQDIVLLSTINPSALCGEIRERISSIYNRIVNRTIHTTSRAMQALAKVRKARG